MNLSWTLVNLSIFLIKDINKIHATILDNLKEMSYGHYSVLDFSCSKKWNITNFNTFDIKIHQRHLKKVYMNITRTVKI